ncbi:MAG: hypothetical protein Q4G33_15635 [bacterium]|nr:hypothetical protein [bacterium]
MKFRKIITIGLAAMMAVSAMSISAFAAESVSVTEPNNIRIGVEPRAVTPSTTVNLNTKENSQTVPWSVYSGFGYWKIHLTNKSDGTIKVRLLKGSPTGAQIGETMVIPANQGLPFYCEEGKPLSTGAYYLEVTSDGNHNLAGELYYKFGSDYESIL